jgi:hypothetical protein
MEAESAKRIAANLDRVPAVPSTIRTWAASQVAADLVAAQRHPINTALTQPSSCGGHRPWASRQVLVAGDSHPVRIGLVHGHDDARSRHGGPGAGLRTRHPSHLLDRGDVDRGLIVEEGRYATAHVRAYRLVVDDLRPGFRLVATPPTQGVRPPDLAGEPPRAGATPA